MRRDTMKTKQADFNFKINKIKIYINNNINKIIK